LLAKFGLTDESMTHLESQIPPPPEVTIDVVESNPIIVAATEAAPPASAPIADPSSLAVPATMAAPEVAAAAAAAMLAVPELAAAVGPASAPMAPPVEATIPREPVTARGPDFAPLSGAVSSSRVTWPEPMEIPPRMAYRSDPEVQTSAPSIEAIAPAPTSAPQPYPEDEITAVGKVDLDAITAVGTVHFPPEAIADPVAPAPSPNPSDPGAESAPQGDLALVPEPGIGMAAAATDADPQTT
ncbi:MAG: hypothetical protein ABW133_23025, partial [Polyangiaceae bacterium]